MKASFAIDQFIRVTVHAAWHADGSGFITKFLQWTKENSIVPEQCTHKLDSYTAIFRPRDARRIREWLEQHGARSE